MIGLPTNFTHTGHIGSGDMAPTPENNHVSMLSRIIDKDIIKSDSSWSESSRETKSEGHRTTWERNGMKKIM